MAALDEEPRGLPRKFGYYVLLHELAHGGMGAVYLARTSGIVGIEKWCVIKTLRADLTEDEEYVARFIDEARVVVTLSHRNICQVFDVGRTEGSYYLAMERVPGRDLRRLLEEAHNLGERITAPLALHVMCEVLEALDYAHRVSDVESGEALGLVHRDVSPANVMLSHEGEVKLIDFGLALTTRNEAKTRPNHVFGKAAYMAPEQMRAERPNARADQFSAGVLAYELLTGQRYYEGLSNAEIFAAAPLGEFRPRGWEHVEPELRAILARATDADPARRFASCAAFKDALVAYVHKRYAPVGMGELRALMARLFPHDGDEFRALLAQLRAALPSLKSKLGPPSDTETIATAPSTEPEHKAASARDAPDSTVSWKTAPSPSSPLVDPPEPADAPDPGAAFAFDMPSTARGEPTSQTMPMFNEQADDLVPTAPMPLPHVPPPPQPQRPLTVIASGVIAGLCVVAWLWWLLSSR